MFDQIRNHPGRYQGNRSQMLARLVHSASMEGVDEEVGDVSSVGWAGRLSGKKYSFIVWEDCAGFVDVAVYKKESPAYYEAWEHAVSILGE